MEHQQKLEYLVNKGLISKNCIKCNEEFWFLNVNCCHSIDSLDVNTPFLTSFPNNKNAVKFAKCNGYNCDTNKDYDKMMCDDCIYYCDVCIEKNTIYCYTCKDQLLDFKSCDCCGGYFCQKCIYNIRYRKVNELVEPEDEYINYCHKCTKETYEQQEWVTLIEKLSLESVLFV